MERSTFQAFGDTIPARLNIALVAVFLSVGMFQLFVLPGMLIPASPWWALLLAPCVLSTTPNWSMIHEAIHRLLTPNLKLNDFLGRVLAVFFGSPFELLRFPHLEHHRLNGTVADRPEHYNSAGVTRAWAAFSYYPKLVLGIYAVEIAGTLICLMPNFVLRRVVRLFPKAHEGEDRAETYLLQPARQAQFRFDACCVVAIYASAFWCYGHYWPLLAVSILARGVIVSIADNSYHYGAPLGAGPRSAYNLKLPAGAGILNFNLHRVHHLHPTLPWSSLPAAFQADAETYDIGYASAMLRQFRGPIADREYARVS